MQTSADFNYFDLFIFIQPPNDSPESCPAVFFYDFVFIYTREYNFNVIFGRN
jgi:hypothetical protein